MKQAQTACKILKEMLYRNENPDGYKQVIKRRMTVLQEKTYWYFTTDEADFLTRIYNKKVEREVLKNRLNRLTDQKMDELFTEIIEGKIVKQKPENEEQTIVPAVYLNVGLKNQSQNTNLKQSNFNIFENNSSKVRQNKEKVKQINEDFRRFKNKIDQIKKKNRQKQLQKEAIEAQIKKSIEKQKKNQFHEQIKKRLQQTKKKEEERKQSKQKYKLFMKEFKKTKPMHILMEQQYKKNVQLPLLDQNNKKKLEVVKHQKKPSLEQLNDHERRYLQRRQENVQKNYVHHQTVDVSFRSHFYNLQQDRMRERQQGETSSSYMFDQLEKKKRYSQFVKQQVKPKISRRLHQSIQQKVQNEATHHEAPDRSRYIEVGKNYLEFMRGIQKKKRSQTPQQVDVIKQSRYIDYLEEFKNKHETHSTHLDWEKDLKDRNASRVEKRQKILMKSKQLEEKAKRQQVFVKNFSYGNAEEIIDRKKQIDDTILSSIRAKVAILKEAQKY